MEKYENIEFEITKMDLKLNGHGKFDLVVSMVKVLKDGKYVKFAKLNSKLLEAMREKGYVKIKSND